MGNVLKKLAGRCWVKKVFLVALMLSFASTAGADSIDNKALVKLLESKGVITKDEAVAVEKDTKPKVDISGEIRIRPEMKSNYDFNDSKDDNKFYVGQRVRLNVKAKPGDNIDAVLTIQDSRRWAEKSQAAYSTTATNSSSTLPTASPSNASSGTEAEALDLFQAYIQVSNVNDLGVDVKIGRQALEYGDQRLVGSSGWADTGRAFDAFKMSYRVSEASKVDMFWAKLSVATNTATGNTAAQLDADLYGLYSTWNFPLIEKSSLDVYYLVWGDATGGLSRNISTYGARIAGKPGAIDFTAEAAFQAGKWSKTVDQVANAWAVTAGYTMKEAWNTRIGAEVDFGSGDDASDTTKHKTFVFPFHGNNHAYYGYMDLFSWGNMNDTRLQLTTKPMDSKTTVDISYHIFTLDSAKDGWYYAAGTGTANLAAAGAKSKTDAGSELDLTLTYPYSPALKVIGGYSIFTPGDAVRERNSGIGDSASWGYLTALLSF